MDSRSGPRGRPRRSAPSASEPAVVEAERTAWLRAMHWALRRRLDGSPRLAAWRRQVPRPLEMEALLMALEPMKDGFQAPLLAGRLGLSLDRTRMLLARARRAQIVEETPSSWRLTRRGRQLLGDLEAAQADALRTVGRGTHPERWAELWSCVQNDEPRD